MQNKKNIFLALFFVTSFLQTKEYVPYDDTAREYRTNKEKTEFLKQRGVKYTNNIEIDYPRFFELNHRTPNLVPLTIEVCCKDCPFNKEIETRHLAAMYFKWVSSEVGYGLFAAEDIQAGDFIGVYAGQLRTYKPIFENRKIANQVPDNTDYAWTYPIKAHGNYPLLIDAQLKGNELALVNHSSENANIEAVYYLHKGIFVLCYVATKNIAKNEEITVNYGEAYCQARNIN
jgi:hypothetical protein